MEQPKRLGDYEVLGKLGSGGMGEVWRVRNVISDRVEAMKVLLPDLVGRQDLAARFLREIKVLASLHHPNIAQLRTALTIDNQLVMIMELVEGESLSHHLRRAPISSKDAIQVVLQVLDALEYAHAQQVIHRDIKPANMMITPQGVVKLTDFGIARSMRDPTLTAVGSTTGSINYISPEQINGGTPDARSDLYSLGVSLYEMLTGAVPFKADADVAVMFAHLQKAPTPPIALQPALSPEMNALVLKAIEKDPSARFQSAGEFRAALMNVPTVAGVPVPAGIAAVAPPPLPPTAPEIPTALAIPAVPAMAPATPPATGAAASVPPQIPVMANTPGAPRPGQPMPPPRRVQGGVGPMLYVALGAFLVVAVVGGLAVYHTIYAEPSGPTAPQNAVDSKTPPPPETAPVQPPAPEAPPATEPAPTASTTPTADPKAGPPPEAATPVPVTHGDAAATAKTPAKPAQPRRASSEPAPAAPAAGTAPAAVAAKNAAAAAREEAARLQEALDQLEGELDQMDAQIDAVNGSLDRLKSEQARMGLGLKADIAARQRSMNTSFSKAQEAADRRDLARAERFKAQAKEDLDTILKFLGR
jgi:outer membrane biosynthesis protein TonB